MVADTGTVGDEPQPMVCDRCGCDCEPKDALGDGWFRCVFCDDRRNSWDPDAELPEGYFGDDD